MHNISDENAHNVLWWQKNLLLIAETSGSPQKTNIVELEFLIKITGSNITYNWQKIYILMLLHIADWLACLSFKITGLFEKTTSARTWQRNVNIAGNKHAYWWWYILLIDYIAYHFESLHIYEMTMQARKLQKIGRQNCILLEINMHIDGDKTAYYL